MSWIQRAIRLQPRPRGFHLVTEELLRALPELRALQVGLAHFFLQHTSASLHLNENASPEVRGDLERFARHLVPDGFAPFRHTLEGPDDMPAHVKAAFWGSSVSVPIHDGRLLLGTWQGIILGEHREHGGARTVVATLHGQPR